jgi:protein-disulfide isomerase
MTRRAFVAGIAAAGVPDLASAQDVGQWFPLVGDDGRAVANTRLPVELTSEVEELPGALWLGSDRRDLMLVEFYDFNCPWCRKAAPDLAVLLSEKPALRLGLVNNAILSPESVEAARVELALQRLGRPASVHRFHQRLFERRGVVNGQRALEVAEEVGAPRGQVEAIAAGDEVAEDLKTQMRLAASLGLMATPSLMAAGAGILGYPGPEALRRVLAEVQRCGRIGC